MAKKKNKNNPFIAFIKVVFIVVSAFILAGYFSIKMYLDELPPIPNLEKYNRNIVTQVYSSDNQLIKTFQTFHYKEVSIKDIPQLMKDTINTTEEKNF